MAHWFIFTIVVLTAHSLPAAASEGCSPRVTGSSKGFDDGCQGGARAECIILNLCGETYKPFAQSFVTGFQRGAAVMIFDPNRCAITEGDTFDLWGDSSRVQPFKDYVNNMPDDTTIILATGDDYTNHLSPDFSLLQELGSPVSDHEFRSSLTIFARKVDGQWCQIAADYKPRSQGPASVDVSLAEMAGKNC